MFQSVVGFSRVLEEHLPMIAGSTELCSLLIGGTMAYAPTTLLALKSDIDLLAIVPSNRHLQELLSHLSGLHVENDQVMDLLDGVETIVANAHLRISVHAFTLLAFESICSLGDSVLTVLRKPSANIQTVWNCPAITQNPNSSFLLTLATETYNDGLLCRYPITISDHIYKYCGPHVQQFMTYYIPIVDCDGHATSQMQKLHKSLANVFEQSTSEDINGNLFSNYVSRHDPWIKSIMRLRTKWFALTSFDGNST